MTDAIFNPTEHSNYIVAYKATDNSRVFLPNMDLSKTTNSGEYDSVIGFNGSGVKTTYTLENIISTCLKISSIANPDTFLTYNTSGDITMVPLGNYIEKTINNDKIFYYDVNGTVTYKTISDILKLFYTDFSGATNDLISYDGTDIVFKSPSEVLLQVFSSTADTVLTINNLG